jgi:GT2 family glycosyltransferase
MKPTVSVVIVVYKNLECVQTCLTSIENDPAIEIIIVNNTHQNRGFGSGCNLGALYATSDVLLFLNPDTRVNTGTILKLAKLVKNDASIGIVGPALIDEEGKVVLSVSKQPTKTSFWWVYSILNRWFKNVSLVREHWYDHQVPQTRREVGVVSGAAMMMRKQVFEQLSGFDERFFLYWEEVDLTRRCFDLDLKVVFDPTYKVVHIGGLSTLENQTLIMKWFRESRYYFMKKHFGRMYALMVEGWLSATEHWQLAATLCLLGLSLNPGAVAVTVPVYNEMPMAKHKGLRAVGGLLVGWAMIWLEMPVEYLLAVCAGWVILDVAGVGKLTRRLYVLSMLVGGLWLR